MTDDLASQIRLRLQTMESTSDYTGATAALQAVVTLVSADQASQRPAWQLSRDVMTTIAQNLEVTTR